MLKKVKFLDAVFDDYHHQTGDTYFIKTITKFIIKKLEPWQLFVFQIASIYRNRGQSVHAMELFSYTLVLSKDLTKWSAKISKYWSIYWSIWNPIRRKIRLLRKLPKKWCSNGLLFFFWRNWVTCGVISNYHFSVHYNLKDNKNILIICSEHLPFDHFFYSCATLFFFNWWCDLKTILINIRKSLGKIITFSVLNIFMLVKQN